MFRSTVFRVAIVLATATGIGIVAAPAANATVKPVKGSAYGYSAKVSFFGGTPKSKAPTPIVKLPVGGSATPITKTAPSGSVVFGPATLLTSGPIAVSTQGTNGSASASSSLQTVDAGPFTASSVSSSCTAHNAAPVGSTTISGGTVVTSTDANGNPTSTVDVPANPPVDYTVNGTLQANGSVQSFKWIFNEQITNTNGSLTINAAHEVLEGPTAVGNMILGQSLCRA